MSKRKQVKASVAAQNTFTDPITIMAGQGANISVSGTFAATVTLQRLLDGVTWQDVPDAIYTGAAEKIYDAVSSHEIRIGVKTGGFTSGTVEVLLETG